MHLKIKVLVIGLAKRWSECSERIAIPFRSRCDDY